MKDIVEPCLTLTGCYFGGTKKHGKLGSLGNLWNSYLGGGFNIFFEFSPRTLGKMNPF